MCYLNVSIKVHQNLQNILEKENNGAFIIIYGIITLIIIISRRDVLGFIIRNGMHLLIINMFISNF